MMYPTDSILSKALSKALSKDWFSTVDTGNIIDSNLQGSWMQSILKRYIPGTVGMIQLRSFNGHYLDIAQFLLYNCHLSILFTIHVHFR